MLNLTKFSEKVKKSTGQKENYCKPCRKPGSIHVLTSLPDYAQVSLLRDTLLNRK